MNEDIARPEGVVPHDARRCPECDSRGTIVELRTGEGIGDRSKAVRSRIFDCWDCDTKWEKYG